MKHRAMKNEREVGEREKGVRKRELSRVYGVQSTYGNNILAKKPSLGNNWKSPLREKERKKKEVDQL